MLPRRSDRHPSDPSHALFRRGSTCVRGVRRSSVRGVCKRLNAEACTCDWSYKSLGRQDRIDMGKGWVRMNTNHLCPIHGRCPKCDKYPKVGTLKTHRCGRLAEHKSGMTE